MPELLPGETRIHSSRVEPEKTIDSKSITRNLFEIIIHEMWRHYTYSWVKGHDDVRVYGNKK